MLNGMDTDTDTDRECECTGASFNNVWVPLHCGHPISSRFMQHLPVGLGNSMKEAAEGPEGRGVAPKIGSYSYSAFGQAQGVDPAVRRSVNRMIEG